MENEPMSHMESAQLNIFLAVMEVKRVLQLAHMENAQVVAKKSGKITAVFSSESNFTIDEAIESLDKATGLLRQAKDSLRKA